MVNVMKDNDLLYWIWLSKIKGIGPVTSRLLLEKFKEPKNIYGADEEQLRGIKGIGISTSELIIKSRDLNKANNVLEKCYKENIKILTYSDKLYPEYAKICYKAPILLYYKGKVNSNSIGIGIVGSRRCTEYGKKIAKETGEFLAKNNIAVISGMAKGIDSYAHTACVNAGGYTIAVLGCGVDVCYPKEHANLMERIIDEGAVISEYSPGTKPDAKNFSKRNNIISMFSKKILVVEAAKNSGALITASCGRGMNREVLAVPNNVYSMESKGCNELIHNGAKIYINPNQLLDGMEEFKINNNELKVEKECAEKEISSVKLDKVEQNILNIVTKEPCTLDEIALKLNIDKSTATEMIFNMELRGIIVFNGGKYEKGLDHI